MEAKYFFLNNLILGFTILSELTFSIGQIKFGLLTELTIFTRQP